MVRLIGDMDGRNKLKNFTQKKGPPFGSPLSLVLSRTLYRLVAVACEERWREFGGGAVVVVGLGRTTAAVAA
jgi:hypothetical protein